MTWSLLTILAFYGLLVAITLLIQVVLAVPQLGLGYLAGPRDEGRVASGAAGRAERCLNNSVVAMVLFAPAVLIHSTHNTATPLVMFAATVFLIARAAYVPVYIAGIPWLRTVIWVAGLLATILLYLLVLLPATTIG